MLCVTNFNGDKLQLHLGEKFTGDDSDIYDIQADGDEKEWLLKSFPGIWGKKQKVINVDGVLVIIVIGHWVIDFNSK